MPAEVVSNSLIPAQNRERITIMDDYGTGFQLYVPVTATPDARAAAISGAIGQQQSNQTALEAYAAAHGIDLSAQKTAGLALKAKAKGATL